MLETQYFSSVRQQRLGMWEGNWGQISQTLLNNVPGAAGKARLAVSYTLYLLPSVYSWLYWFSFGKSLPWLPSTPLLLIHPGNIQVYTALPPWLLSLMWVGASALVLVDVSGAEDRGLCGRVLWLPPALPLGKTRGLFSWHLLQQSSQAVWNAVSYPSEDEE